MHVPKNEIAESFAFYVVRPSVVERKRKDKMAHSGERRNKKKEKKREKKKNPYKKGGKFRGTNVELKNKK